MGTTSNGILSNGNGNPSFHHVNDYAGHQDVMSNGDSHDFTTRTKWSNGPSSSTTTKQHNDNSQLSSLLPDSISTDVNDTWQATQEIQSQALPSTQTSHREQPTPPPSTLPEEHWATLIPDTANRDCPRIELHGTKEKIIHVIGRREKYISEVTNKPCPTDTIIKHAVISGLHCKIWREWDPEAPEDPSQAVAYLEDFSTNGTTVNGTKFRHSKTRIWDGDDISLGPNAPGRDLASEFRFRFQLEYIKTERLHQRRDPDDAGGLYKKYDIRGQVGSGSFATVHRVINKQTGEWFAVKIIDKARFKHNPKTVLMLQREVNIMQNLDNPYIVKYVEGFEDDDKVWLIMEFVSGGDLLDFVIGKGGLSEVEASDVALQICEAMSYLHQQGVAHRDLKPENILMTKGENPRCKIADFGLAKLPGADTFLKTMCGTPTYLAPEVILQGPELPGYSFAVDAWSVGVIIYSCMANASPFVDNDENEGLYEKMLRRQPDLQLLLDSGFSAAAIDFCSRFMTVDPAKRMTVYDALEHPWLAPMQRRRQLERTASTLSRDAGSQGKGSQSQRRAGRTQQRQLSAVASLDGPRDAADDSEESSWVHEHQKLNDGPTTPASFDGPQSNISSMMSLSRTHTMTDDDNDDAVSEAPSYSQRMGRLRIESNFELNGSGIVEDSQESGYSGKDAILLAEEEENADLTPPMRVQDGKEMSEPPSQGIKRKLPTSAFSSDESMDASPNIGTADSASVNGPTVTSNLEQMPNLTPVHGQDDKPVIIKDTTSANGIAAVDFGLRTPPSPAPSDSSLSSLEDSPPKARPMTRALTEKSINKPGKRSSVQRTGRASVSPADGPTRRSTRLSAAHVTTYAESDSDSEKTKNRRKSTTGTRARKQPRMSVPL